MSQDLAVWWADFYISNCDFISVYLSIGETERFEFKGKMFFFLFKASRLIDSAVLRKRM